VVKVPDTDALRDALDRWKAGIDAQEPERVADVFAEDTIFQGLRPYSVGRQGVIDYYASQSPGWPQTRCSDTSTLTSHFHTGPPSACSSVW
jgi:SnoaL-like domain